MAAPAQNSEIGQRIVTPFAGDDMVDMTFIQWNRGLILAVETLAIGIEAI